VRGRKLAALGLLFSGLAGQSESSMKKECEFLYTVLDCVFVHIRRAANLHNIQIDPGTNRRDSSCMKGTVKGNICFFYNFKQAPSGKTLIE
jgi:hypothetical protein